VGGVKVMQKPPGFGNFFDWKPISRAEQEKEKAKKYRETCGGYGCYHCHLQTIMGFCSVDENEGR